MTMTNNETADLLEKVADYIDVLAGDEHRRVHQANADKVASIAASFEASTGQELDAETRSKLASADNAVLDLLTKTAQTAGGSPESLGGPSDNPTHDKTASHNPEDKFLSWIMS